MSSPGGVTEIFGDGPRDPPTGGQLFSTQLRSLFLEAYSQLFLTSPATKSDRRSFISLPMFGCLSHYPCVAFMTLDEAENGFFTHDGVEYFLEDSDGAVFYRNGDDENAEELYYWDFASKDGVHRMGIEEWRDGSVDVTYSRALQSGQVSVFSLRGEQP